MISDYNLSKIRRACIASVEYPEDQKTIDISRDSKSVRLDIYVEDEARTVYNVKIQAANTKENCKHIR